MYQFSVPMPYYKEDIDKVISINKEIEQSRISSLYFSLSSSSELFTGFEQYRNEYAKDWDYWKKLISYSQDKGFELVYLLNRPNSASNDEQGLKIQLYKLDNLLNEFRKIGLNKLRISDHQLLSYLNIKYPDFILYASTSFEYKQIGEYTNFVKFHPYIKQIVPSQDSNKNFLLLKNLIKMLPNTQIEILANEGCLLNCHLRMFHGSCQDNNHQNIFSYKYYINECREFCRKNISIFERLTKSNIIYPWEIKEYAKIGIKNFKLSGRDNFPLQTNSLINTYFYYLKCIECFEDAKNLSLDTFISKLRNNEIVSRLTVKDCKKYLPDIKHFVKFGHLCASRCGVECRYCYRCAEKIQAHFKADANAARAEILPVCIKTAPE